MEKEINIIKKTYQSITPPKELLIHGVDDLWHRIDSRKQFFNIYFTRTAIIGGIVLLIFSGFLGVSFAYPKPGTIFYQVKKLTQNTLNTLSKTPLLQMYSAQIQKNSTIDKRLQPTPTPIESGPTVSSKSTENVVPITDEGEKANSINHQSNPQPSQGQNSTKQDVKGVSASANDNSNNRNSKNENKGNNNNRQNNGNGGHGK